MSKVYWSRHNAEITFTHGIRTTNHTRFPSGWNEERVRKVLAHYEEQTEEAVAEDEAAFEDPDQTVMEVPHALVPVIRELIAQHQAQTWSI